MREYYSEGIVLKNEPLKEADGRICVFTHKFGKITARAISSRKIVSKLNPHLQPGFVSLVRFVEKNTLHVVDALKAGTVAATPAALHLAEELLPEFEPDEAMWGALRAPIFSWASVLAAAGWGPESAQCRVCEAAPVAAFHVPSQEFYCAAHAPARSRCGVIALS